MNNTFKSFAAGVLFTLVIMLTVLTGASCTETQPSQATGDAGDCKDMVLARVGESNVTLGDLLENPSFYGLVGEQLIVRELMDQEVLKRGITIDMDEIEGMVDKMIEDAGGWEVFTSSIPQSIPVSLIRDDLRNGYMQQAHHRAIIEDRYEKEHGPATDDELETRWLATPGMYEATLAAEMGIQPEDITFEMAREKIAESIKTQWQDDRFQILVDYLKENTEIEFYLLDAINQRSDIQIPEIDGDDSFEYVPLEEHDVEGHEESGLDDEDQGEESEAGETGEAEESEVDETGEAEESEAGETGEAEEAEVPDEPEEDEGN